MDHRNCHAVSAIAVFAQRVWFIAKKKKKHKSGDIYLTCQKWSLFLCVSREDFCRYCLFVGVGHFQCVVEENHRVEGNLDLQRFRVLCHSSGADNRRLCFHLLRCQEKFGTVEQKAILEEGAPFSLL